MAKINETPEELVGTIAIMLLCVFAAIALPVFFIAHAVNKDISKIEDEAKEIIYVTALEHETRTVAEGGKFSNVNGGLKEVPLKDETLKISTEDIDNFDYIIHAIVYKDNKESSGRMFEYKYDSTKDEIERVYVDTLKSKTSTNQ